MTINENVIKGGLSTQAAILSFGKFAETISHLAIAAFLSYNFSKTDYGTYRQVWLIYNTLTPVLILGLPLSINYFIPQMKRSNQKSFNIQTYFLLAGLGFFLSSSLFFGAPLISNWLNNQNLIELLRIFSLIPLLTFPTIYYQNLFVCLNKAILATLISIFMAFGLLGSAIIPVLLGYSIREIFLIFNLFSFVQLLIVTYLIFKPFKKIKIEWKIILLFKQIKYSIPIGLTVIVAMLIKQIDKFFISTFFSVSQFAIYINGAFEIPLIGIVTGSVTAVLMPEFVKLLHAGDRIRLIQIWHSAIRKVALIIIPVMFFFLVFATESIALLFSQKYVESSSIFRIYLLSLPIRITNFGMVLLALGLSSEVLKYSIYSLFLNFVLNYVLIQVLGFPGPAIATVIITYFVAFLQLRKIAQELNIHLRDIFPWITLCKIFLTAMATGGIIQFFKLLIVIDKITISLAVGIILYAIIFFALGFFLKIILKKDLKTLIKIINAVLKK